MEYVEKETLHLHVRYRTMREEIETRLDSEVRRVIGTHANENEEERVERMRGKLIAALAADASWVHGYLYAGELDLKRVDSLAEEEEEMMKVILERLKEGDQEEKDEWHELIIPVDLPFMHVRLFHRSF
jgi:trafficking protein particle complex subunit 10